MTAHPDNTTSIAGFVKEKTILTNENVRTTYQVKKRNIMMRTQLIKHGIKRRVRTRWTCKPSVQLTSSPFVLNIYEKPTVDTRRLHTTPISCPLYPGVIIRPRRQGSRGTAPFAVNNISQVLMPASTKPND